MSNLVCPECGSTNIMTERRVNGYHVCLECHNFWSNGVKPTLTVFQKITASEEVLAEKLVYCVFNAWGESHWKSTVIGEKKFPTLTKAIAATIARLKEVSEDD
jgi:transcription initiation factor TFIIIB Brf1 subunit/transcription initiation factor TFIIB